jgi:hypothetical protein
MLTKLIAKNTEGRREKYLTKLCVLFDILYG